mmetsp:Transcript_18260/g.33563  ORF Transcript_18260/g.33563 Transcript_18260/m.33563 type:complete len:626 (+) Transcript_18260:80-1957(+)
MNDPASFTLGKDLVNLSLVDISDIAGHVQGTVLLPAGIDFDADFFEVGFASTQTIEHPLQRVVSGWPPLPISGTVVTLEAEQNYSINASYQVVCTTTTTTTSTSTTTTSTSTTSTTSSTSTSATATADAIVVGYQVDLVEANLTLNTTTSTTVTTTTTTTVAYCPVPIPAGATHLTLSTSVSNENETGIIIQYAKIVDWTGERPTAKPRVVKFRDEESRPGQIRGIVNITVPVPEPIDIESYRVYFEGKGSIIQRLRKGGRPRWLAEAKATGYNVQAHIGPGTIVPGDTYRLYVVAANRDGEAAIGQTTTLYDVGSGTADSTRIPVAEAAAITAAVVAFFALVIAVLLLKKCSFGRLCSRKKKKGASGRRGDQRSIRDGGANEYVQATENPPPAQLALAEAAEGAGQETPDTSGLGRAVTGTPLPSHIAALSSASTPAERRAQEGPDDWVEGDPVEYWSTTHKLLMPATIDSHSVPRELALKLFSTIVQPVDPNRIRRPLQKGESVEVWDNDKWVPGNVSDNPRLVKYNILQLDGESKTDVDAHQVRRSYRNNDDVEVWTEKRWLLAKVIQAAEPEGTGKMDIFTSQKLVVEANSRKAKVTSKEVRWFVPEMVQEEEIACTETEI